MVNQKWVNASIINNILYFAYFPYIILYAAKTIDTHVHALYYNNNNISHIIQFVCGAQSMFCVRTTRYVLYTYIILLCVLLLRDTSRMVMTMCTFTVRTLNGYRVIYDRRTRKCDEIRRSTTTILQQVQYPYIIL